VTATNGHTRLSTPSQRAIVRGAKTTTEAAMATAVAASGSSSLASRRFQSACRNAAPRARAKAAAGIVAAG
jgi:hypothetical protein